MPLLFIFAENVPSSLKEKNRTIFQNVRGFPGDILFMQLINLQILGRRLSNNLEILGADNKGRNIFYFYFL